MASCLFSPTIHQKCISYSKLIRRQCGCNRIPELKSERAACRASLSLRGPITTTPGRYNFLLSALRLSVSTLCFSIFANVLVCPIIVHPRFLLSVPSSHPPISLFFFSPLPSQPEGQCFIMIYQSVFCSGHDSSTDGLMKYTLFFFSPAVPHLPIKRRLILSNWCLSSGVMN